MEPRKEITGMKKGFHGRLWRYVMWAVIIWAALAYFFRWSRYHGPERTEPKTAGIETAPATAGENK